MVNDAENYPYPYVIGRLCWQFPCLMPSDWDAQNLNGKMSPQTIRDLKTAIDATVIKQGVFRFGLRGWQPLPFGLPEGTALVDAEGRDAGLRFVDIDEDGHDDLVFSNVHRYSVNLFVSMASGWSRKLLAGQRGASDTNSEHDELPVIVRGDGTNNGAWFSYGHMWVQNEDTAGKLPEHVDSHRWTNKF